MISFRFDQRHVRVDAVTHVLPGMSVALRFRGCRRHGGERGGVSRAHLCCWGAFLSSCPFTLLIFCACSAFPGPHLQTCCKLRVLQLTIANCVLSPLPHLRRQGVSQREAAGWRSELCSLIPRADLCSRLSVGTGHPAAAAGTTNRTSGHLLAIFVEIKQEGP